MAILKGLRSRYEEHHRVEITDEALEAAVKLSSRYINDRFLPDKAIDLIDEASSRVRLMNYTKPDKDPAAGGKDQRRWRRKRSRPSKPRPTKRPARSRKSSRS